MKNNIVVIEENANSLSSKIDVPDFETISVTNIVEPHDILNLEPAIILIDDMSLRRLGTEFCKNLKKNSAADIYVLIVSNHPNIKDLARLYGADDYLRKPFSSQQAITKIMSLIPANRNKLS